MRWWWLAAATSFVLLSGCAETVRCPDGQVFGDNGDCAPIPDAGPPRDGGDDDPEG